MTEAVIHRLEVIEIQHQDGIEAASTLEALVCMFETIFEERSIREAGECIVKGLVLELTLQTGAVGDIARADDHCGLAVEDRLASVDLHVNHAAILGCVTDAFKVRASSPHRMQVVAQLFTILRRTYLRKREREELGTTVSIHRDRGAVDRKELQVAVLGGHSGQPGDEHCLRVLVEEQAKCFLACRCDASLRGE